MAKLNTDVYNMSQVLLDVQKEYFEEQSVDTLALGSYGFLNAVCSKMLQTSIKVSSELSNEMFPTKARLEKNVITHAIVNNITDINAVPAKMDILLCILESDYNKHLEEQGGLADSVTIDKNSKFYIGEYEYHLDYDMIVSKSILANEVSVYTARYNMTVSNTLSDVEVPYLSSPYLVRNNADTYIFIACHLRQVEQTTIYNKIITNDAIDNKTYEFEFDNQLASFDVYVKDGNNTVHLMPIFEGGNTEGVANYCWYTYIDSTTIRVKFDSSSYMPRINSEIETDVKTTRGEKCNFKYNEDIITTIEDTDRFTYNRMQVAISPTGDSEGGQDRKSAKELRRILPKEALSRGSLINITDLNNYFNTLNTQNNRMLFREKVHNQFERSHYCYVLLKDTLGNIAPTNTIDMYIKNSDFDIVNNPDNPDMKQYIFRQGCAIGYIFNEIAQSWDGYLLNDFTEEDAGNYHFVYTIPFKAVINHSGPFISYYMTIMKDRYRLIFSYINDQVPLQFICSTVYWSRDILVDTDKYILDLNLKQNIDMDMGVVTIVEEEDEDGNPIETTVSSMKLYAVIYDELENPYRYMIANKHKEDDIDEFSYNYKFEFITPDIINEDNCIRIDNVYLPNGDSTEQYGYLQQTSKIDIFVLNKFVDEDGNVVEHGLHGLDEVVPLSEIEGYSVTNTYEIMNGLTFFDNYSEIVSTIVTPEAIYDKELETTVDGFKLSGVPVIGYQYSQNSRNIINFINAIKVRKAYIDEALKILENQFSIDFKFYNTYGPARVYTIDGSNPLNKVNVSFKFNLSLKKTSDDYTKEYIIKFIKDYIENLDNIGSNIHIPNLISDITKTYINSINYIEFVGFNCYDASHQHFYYSTETEINTIPEFACIDIGRDGSPSINIHII